MKKVFAWALLAWSGFTFAKGADLLFLQMANQGALAPATAHTYTVTLNHPSKYVGYFTDRPERKYGVMTLTQFIDFWSNARIHDNFSQNPPNAAVVLINDKGQTHSFVAEVLSADIGKNGLSYEIRPLDSKIKLSTSHLNHITLVFDHIHWNPGGFLAAQ